MAVSHILVINQKSFKLVFLKSFVINCFCNC